MKVTRYDLELTRPSVVALGVFDGVHLGHQTIVRRVVERARELGAAASVVTFDPHPAAVVSSSGGPAVLATLSQRLEWFEQLGVDQVRLIDFTMDIARQSAEQFVDEILVAQLGALSVVVGDDAHFGRAREGNLETLRVLGASRGFEVESAGALGEGRRYSSSLVRELLGEGDVEGANHVLGRPFTLRGVVMHGDARGRQIGYPTANLDTQEHQALPQLGIYAGLTRVEGDWIPSAISVGTRPQFYDGARPSLSPTSSTTGGISTTPRSTSPFSASCGPRRAFPPSRPWSSRWVETSRRPERSARRTVLGAPTC